MPKRRKLNTSPKPQVNPFKYIAEVIHVCMLKYLSLEDLVATRIVSTNFEKRCRETVSLMEDVRISSESELKLAVASRRAEKIKFEYRVSEENAWQIVEILLHNKKYLHKLDVKNMPQVAIEDFLARSSQFPHLDVMVNCHPFLDTPHAYCDFKKLIAVSWNGFDYTQQDQCDSLYYLSHSKTLRTLKIEMADLEIVRQLARFKQLEVLTIDTLDTNDVIDTSQLDLSCTEFDFPNLTFLHLNIFLGDIMHSVLKGMRKLDTCVIFAHTSEDDRLQLHIDDVRQFLDLFDANRTSLERLILYFPLRFYVLLQASKLVFTACKYADFTVFDTLNPAGALEAFGKFLETCLPNVETLRVTAQLATKTCEGILELVKNWQRLILMLKNLKKFKLVIYSLDGMNVTHLKFGSKEWELGSIEKLDSFKECPVELIFNKRDL